MGNDNEKPQDRLLQPSGELGVITSFTVLESQFTDAGPTSWALCRPDSATRSLVSLATGILLADRI